MTTFSVRVADDLAARFDAAAARAGGRSALLRRLIGEAAALELGRPRRPREPRTGARVMVRLTAGETRVVDIEASAMGLPRAGWIAALVRYRVSGQPTFERTAELDLAVVRSELRRIGVNVNQIARALNTAVLEGRVLDLELAELNSLRRQIRVYVLALREALNGNQAYWETEL